MVNPSALFCTCVTETLWGRATREQPAGVLTCPVAGAGEGMEHPRVFNTEVLLLGEPGTGPEDCRSSAITFGQGMGVRSSLGIQLEESRALTQGTLVPLPPRPKFQLLAGMCLAQVGEDPEHSILQRCCTQEGLAGAELQ